MTRSDGRSGWSRPARCTASLLAVGLALGACTGVDPAALGEAPPPATTAAATGPGENQRPGAAEPSGVVTLAFAGDVHFEGHLAALPGDARSGLGPIGRVLADADVAMVNLESAVTRRGRPAPKELEVPANRYHFRTSPAALDVLARAGVDVVTLANNHAADYGRRGFADTLRAARTGPVAVVGIGRDAAAAFTPYRVDVDGTRLAFLAADASPREGSSSLWQAGPTTPGIAAARGFRPRQLLAAVRAAGRRADVVVVYLHWGREYQPCPTARQRGVASALARAGADVVVGTHAHVLMGSGWRYGSYVNYGLSGFLWYHDHRPDTGVLRLRVRDGAVVADRWVPALIQPSGPPLPLQGAAGDEAVADWDALRDCAELAPDPGAAPERGFVSSVRRIGPALRERMRASHGAGCPVALGDLRHVRVSHVGFDGRTHTGELVLSARYVRDVVGVFEKLYLARWPIRRMRLVDAYGGSDAASMAAGNSSAYNCRRVAGQDTWSAHAYGAAIDLNPIRNPYLRGARISPRAGDEFATIDRSGAARVPPGVIEAGDVVVRAFAAIGWEWGGFWAEPDYQHFAAR